MTTGNLLTEVLARYSDFGIDLGIDLVAILVMAYVLYFRRHWRADLLLSFITLNVGIFAVMSVLTLVRIDVATGFGLFAILSIIRLRSSSVTQQEVAYYFVALVLGLINGMNLSDRVLVVALNVLLLVVMAVFDSTAVRNRSRHVEVQLKGRYDSDAALVAALERELGGRVMSHEVTAIDLTHHHTTVDVRYRPGTAAARHALDETAASGPVEALPVESGAVVPAPADPRQVADGPATEEAELRPAAETKALVSVGAGDGSGDRRAE